MKRTAGRPNKCAALSSLSCSHQRKIGKGKARVSWIGELIKDGMSSKNVEYSTFTAASTDVINGGAKIENSSSIDSIASTSLVVAQDQSVENGSSSNGRASRPRYALKNKGNFCNICFYKKGLIVTKTGLEACLCVLEPLVVQHGTHLIGLVDMFQPLSPFG